MMFYDIVEEEFFSVAKKEETMAYVLSEVERAKIILAKDSLNKKEEKLLGELREERSLVSYAMTNYGSELAGDVRRDELRLMLEIEDVKETIALLNDFLAGRFDIEKENAFKEAVALANQSIWDRESEIFQLKEGIAHLEESLDKITQIKSFLA